VEPWEIAAAIGTDGRRERASLSVKGHQAVFMTEEKSVA
jgi:hypothetical protein